MSEQIIKWCDAICHNEDEMHLGSYRTFKMIKDESIQLSQQIQHLEQQLQQAHRQGWEQCKREAVDHLRYQHNLVVGEASLDYLATLEQCWNAIASMEYKEVNND